MSGRATTQPPPHESRQARRPHGKQIQKVERDPFGDLLIYRLRVDSLVLVSKVSGGQVMTAEEQKRRLTFVQGLLCQALFAEPALSPLQRQRVADFQRDTVREMLADMRGRRERRSAGRDWGHDKLVPVERV